MVSPTVDLAIPMEVDKVHEGLVAAVAGKADGMPALESQLRRKYALLPSAHLLTTLQINQTAAI